MKRKKRRRKRRKRRREWKSAVASQSKGDLGKSGAFCRNAFTFPLSNNLFISS